MVNAKSNPETCYITISLLCYLSVLMKQSQSARENPKKYKMLLAITKGDKS